MFYAWLPIENYWGKSKIENRCDYILFKLWFMNAYRKSNTFNNFLPWIVSSLEYFPHFNFQKRIVSAETIRGNTVIEISSCRRTLVRRWYGKNLNGLGLKVINAWLALEMNINVTTLTASSQKAIYRIH